MGVQSEFLNGLLRSYRMIMGSTIQGRPAACGLIILLFSGILLAASINAQQEGPSTREMDRINWMEFCEWVPAKINTVLLPLGTIDAPDIMTHGADIIAPVAIAKKIAPRVNAMIAPVIPYSFIGGTNAYSGSSTVAQDSYRAYVRAVLVGLAKSKFKNIILLNGRAGGQSVILSALAQEVGRETGTHILAVNWSSYYSDVKDGWVITKPVDPSRDARRF